MRAIGVHSFAPNSWRKYGTIFVSPVAWPFSSLRKAERISLNTPPKLSPSSSCQFNDVTANLNFLSMILPSLNYLMISYMKRILLIFRIMQSELKQNNTSIDVLCTHRNLFDIWEENNFLIENKHVVIKNASLFYVVLHFCKDVSKKACGNAKAGMKKLQNFKTSS